MVYQNTFGPYAVRGEITPKSYDNDNSNNDTNDDKYEPTSIHGYSPDGFLLHFLLLLMMMSNPLLLLWNNPLLPGLNSGTRNNPLLLLRRTRRDDALTLELD